MCRWEQSRPACCLSEVDQNDDDCDDDHDENEEVEEEAVPLSENESKECPEFDGAEL